MMCFRDKSFCSSDCINSACHRHFGDADWELAKKWWGNDKNVPIAYMDFRTGCESYIAPGKRTEDLIQADGR